MSDVEDAWGEGERERERELEIERGVVYLA